ncbi:beta-1,3-galactosyltransferase 1-like [Montipora capricornis]|uniref:beta-1,3-galactosyltransferase 1-like n=1 Tax=Montipora capricornis TaxID=246305 RepID=UPI0035F12965
MSRNAMAFHWRRKRGIVWFGICLSILTLLFYLSQRSDSYDQGRAFVDLSNKLRLLCDDVRNKRQANSSIKVSAVSSSCTQLNFSFSSVVVEPSVSAMESNLFMFVLVTSGVTDKFSVKRNAIRNTWLKQTGPNIWWRHAFVLGSVENGDGLSENEIKREAQRYNDILQFSSIDNYNNLVIKVLSGFRWAVTQVDPVFVLKADDDVYIRLPRLMLWLSNFGKSQFYGGQVTKGAIYVKDLGALVERFSGTNNVSFDCYAEPRFALYPVGAFYVLSSDAIVSLFQKMRKWKVFPVEDAYLGVVARDIGLKPVDIPGFLIRNRHFPYLRCTWNSLLALGHKFTSSDFYYIESKFLETDKLNLSTNFCGCVVYTFLTHPFVCVFMCFGVILIGVVEVIRQKRIF